MGARRDRGFGDAIGLSLERPDCVDDEIRPGGSEGGGEVAGHVHLVPFRWIHRLEPRRRGLCPGTRAAGDEQLDVRIARQAPRDMRAEIAGAAEEEDAPHPAGLATIRAKIAIIAAKAGQPSANQIRRSRS